MRNLLRYPITRAEKISALEWALRELGTARPIEEYHGYGEAYGDVTWAALLAVMADLQASERVDDERV